MTLNFPRSRSAHRRRHVLAACTLVLAAAGAAAQPAASPASPAAPASAAFSPASGPGLQAADAKLGEQLAKAGKPPQVPACVGCHGADGMGVATFPRLAGTGVHYLSEQLQALADGRRNNATMSPIAKAMTDAERAGAALYFSRLPARPRYAPAVAADDPGAWLATRGRWADGIPACASCHGPAGQGVGDSFPPLAGLPQAYIEEQLAAWQNAGRPEGPMDLMRGVAARLKPADVKAVAAYYSGFSATPAAAAATAAASAPATAASGAKP